MGVADNRTYKQEYHFRDEHGNRRVGEDYPSIHEEPKINTTIKDNPYRSNVEIEGGEIVLQPDMKALFKARGKRHVSGGMDVLLRPNSFIFSDFKGLAISDKDLETFELKGGKTNTPADVLKKNIDIKHYNSMVTILEDPYKDDLSKKTAAMMIEKYISSLGNIAYIQEDKKKFPQGLPHFSMGAAPVYNPELKAEIEANKQYMKAGGNVNPYRMQPGGLTPDEAKRYMQLKYQKGRLSRNEGMELRALDERFNGQPATTATASANSSLTDFQRWAELTGKGRLSRAEGQELRTLDERMRQGQPQNQPLTFDQSNYPRMLPSSQRVDPNQRGSNWMDAMNDFSRSVGQRPAATPPSGMSINEYLASDQYRNQQPMVDASQPTTTTKGTPQAPADQWGLWQGDQMPVFMDRFGTSNAADKISNLDRLADMLGYTGPKSNRAFQKWLYNASPENKAIIDKWHTKYGQPYAGNPIDDKIGIRWQSAIKEILTTRPPAPTPKDFSIGPRPTPGGPARIDTLDPTAVNVTPQGVKRADWRFTPWQRLSQFHNLGQWANVKRYMPYRSKYNATYVDPALVNPEQAVGDVQAAGNQQIASLSTLSPILRNAQASQISGQVMNQLPGIRSQYDNQNAQILNQTRQYNNQVKNNETLVNTAYDQQYYTQAVEGRKNFDNMRQYLSNQYMNNLLRDVETNQKLAYNLLTQNNPAYGYDWNTGDFYRNPKNILDVESSNINNRYQALQEMLDQITDPTERVKQAIKLEGIKAFGNAQAAPNFLAKKGGKIKSKNPYRY